MFNAHIFCYIDNNCLHKTLNCCIHISKFETSETRQDALLQEYYSLKKYGYS